jgi:hypothetical protein
VGEWILIWTFFCKADFHEDCRYYHKSNLTFSECVERLVEIDHQLRYSDRGYVPHVVYCTDNPELREKVREHNRKYKYKLYSDK